MPGGDGTGPWWAQGRWNCWRGRGWSGLGAGRGRGIGYGFGRGIGRGYGPNYPAAAQQPAYQPAQQNQRDAELSELKSYAEDLRAGLEGIYKRIAALEKR